MFHAIGLDIGGTKIAAATFDPAGRQTSEVLRRATPRDYASLLAVCADLYRELAVGACTLGVGIPGAIDRKTGHIVSGNLPFLADNNFRRDIAQTLAIPDVPVANDADCLALAEATDGAGQGFDTVLTLIVGTGIGSGFVCDGHIVHGPNGLTGEIGHLPLPLREPEDGPLLKCPGCGQKGCVETSISGPALGRLYAFMTGRTEKRPEEIIREAESGDSVAQAVLDRYYTVFAKALIPILHAFDPYAIVIAGGLSALRGLYEEVPKRWGRYGIVKKPKTRLLPALHGPMAGLRGAAYLGRTALPAAPTAKTDRISNA